MVYNDGEKGTMQKEGPRMQNNEKSLDVRAVVETNAWSGVLL